VRHGLKPVTGGMARRDQVRGDKVQQFFFTKEEPENACLQLPYARPSN
jgi:hypothetical protein